MDSLSEALAAIAARLGRIEAVAELAGRTPGPEWLTPPGAGRALGRAEFTVREWCRHGRLNAAKRATGRGPHPAWVISREELARYRRDGLLPPR